MNMFARFNENRAMILQDIKETKRYGRTDGRTKTVYPLQTKFAGGIIRSWAMLDISTGAFGLRREKTRLSGVSDIA